MHRDMDLVRAILLAVESHPEGFAPQHLAIDGYTPEQIGYHATILREAGLVEAIDLTAHNSTGPMAITFLLEATTLGILRQNGGST
jgi:DNA-binding transcriptional ArsR family regulator